MDPIADMLTAIRNAQAVKKDVINVPFSRLKYEIAKILAKCAFVEKVELESRKTKKNISLILKYTSDKTPTISGLKKISKPGQRIYKKFEKIRKVRGGYGIAIISTSKGLMTDKEARKKKLGGEVLCEIW